MTTTDPAPRSRQQRSIDEREMRSALSLARRGLGQTHPNPSVGCILTRPDLNGRIVGRGSTRPGGRPHAETMALTQAGDLARGATAYVTLEPCSHQGATPPCADALIEAGITRAVIAIRDPDPRVAGRGIARLMEAGIDVVTGVREDEARWLNDGFFQRIIDGRPHFTLKLATSIDGRIATHTGESQWITSPSARALGHALRARHDLILTGAGTLRADDPAMTCRLPGLTGATPIRAVMTRNCKGLDTQSHALFNDAAETWLLRSAGTSAAAGAATVRQIEVTTDSNGYLDPGAVAETLAGEGITRVLIEAGANLSASFLRTGLVDEIWCFRGPILIGGDGLSSLASLGLDRLADAPQFRLSDRRVVEGDTVDHYVAET